MTKALEYLEETVITRSYIHNGRKIPLTVKQINSLDLPEGKYFVIEEVIESRVTIREQDIKYAIEMAYLEGQRDMLKDVSAICDVSEFVKNEEKVVS